MENKKFHDKFGQEFNTGDIIEFKTKSLFHSHWGIYVGNGKYIDSRQVGKLSNYILFGRREIMMRKRKLDLVEEGVLHRNNFMDKVYEPRKPDEIVKTAEDFHNLSLDDEQDFLNHAFDSKQFVLFCRYKNVPKPRRSLREVASIVLNGVNVYALSRAAKYILHR